MSANRNSAADPDATIAELEAQIAELTARLNAARRAASGREVPDYTFRTLAGEARLSELFAGGDKLLAIHNMGQGCRYCTLWADGINGFLPHLESAMAVVLLSKDDPETQRRFANARGWRFQLASHAGGAYIRDESVMAGDDNMPGAVLYERKGGKLHRRNAAVFGPNDLFCSAWNILALAGHGVDDWIPQFTYWRRPDTLDDGGRNLVE